MTRLTFGSRAWLAWLLLPVMGALGVGCSNSKTIVHVTVNGDVSGIVQLVVGLNAGGLITQLLIPPTADVISLPTDFTVEMDRSRTGELLVTIDGYPAAFSMDAVKIATGMGDITDLAVGGQNQVTVELMAVAPVGSEPDGGAGSDGGNPGATPDAGDAVTEDTGP